MRKSGLSAPQLPGIGSLNLFEDGPLNGQKILIIPDIFHSMKIYAPLINRLNSQFRLAIIDLPGHFSSASPENLTLPLLVDEFVQLIDYLGWSQFSIVGHGIGCQIGCLLSSQFLISNFFSMSPSCSLYEECEFRKIVGSCCRSEITWNFNPIIDGIFKVSAGESWKSIFSLSNDVLINIWEKYEQVDFRDNDLYYQLDGKPIDKVKFIIFQNDCMMKSKQAVKFFKEIKLSQEVDVVMIEQASHTPFLDVDILIKIADIILSSFQTSFATK
ncbi:Alpha/beta hydrolase family protein [Spironucleus salmonicida]|uniref:Alpha/beta hydrolase family protein n=1 Tax=Spironucleus salmonicida TaxID=348837 RepID=V6M4C8_9EUKA|nr:Alpha/beta hydrolase family protein [Spironucleus salmonicida]|eukprot:EST48164.1 Alpha/beta hydrolase family protein [Spironucleus salmonicida]